MGALGRNPQSEILQNAFHRRLRYSGRGTRNQIAAELLNWGHRVQYSVFECDLDQRRARKLEGRLRALVSGPDNIRIYPLCGGCRGRVVTIGGKPVTADVNYYQV